MSPRKASHPGVYESVRGRPGSVRSAEPETVGDDVTDPGGGGEDDVGGARDRDEELGAARADRGQAAPGQ